MNQALERDLWDQLSHTGCSNPALSSVSSNSLSFISSSQCGIESECEPTPACPLFLQGMGCGVGMEQDWPGTHRAALQQSGEI